MQAERKVDHQFHARARAAGAKVKRARGEGTKEIAAGIEGARATASHYDGSAQTHQAARSADGGVQILDAAAGKTCAERFHGFRLSRGGVHHERAHG